MSFLERLIAFFKGSDKEPDDGRQDTGVPENDGDPYDVEYENLAMPEVHTGKVSPGEPAQPGGDDAREFQAIPEYSKSERTKGE